MNDPARTPTTSETLLRDLAARPDSPRAEEFARLYEPVLRRYVAQARIGHAPIQPADRDDLVQELFLAVRSALPGFRRVALEGESPVDVGREFKLKPNAVYQIRNRILRAVREELDRFGRGRLSASDLLDALESAD